MASLQPTCCQHPPPGRRAEQAQPRQPVAGSSRRSTLGAALLAAGAAALPAPLLPRPAAADELAAAAQAVPVVQETVPLAAAADPNLDVARWPMWVDRTFSFSYPPGLYEVQDLSFAAPPRPRAGAEQVAENPLKAEVRSEDGSQRINVVVRQATAYKRTLFQVTDIAQLGDARSVAKLLLPAGAIVQSVQTVSVAQPSKDTGTVLGVIERDPVTYYSYEVLLVDKTRLQLTAAAQLGRLYLLAATAPDSQWAQVGPALKETALSFRLRYKV